jgi:membrane protein
MSFTPSSSAAATAREPLPETAAEKLVRHWRLMVRERGMLTLIYLTKTEAHTFAFSVAANAILSFFPFMMLIMWLIRNVFHSQGMFDAVAQLLRDHLPTNQEYVIRNLDAMVRARQQVKFMSILILLITSTGVFLPLEVAFNQIWGFTKNRSYLGNQVVSLALAFGCGLLAMASIGLAAGNQWVVNFILFGHRNVVFTIITSVVLRILATIASIGLFFLLYWLLPNGKVSPASVLPAAVAMGLLWECSRYLYIKSLPLLNFPEVYGPFSISVTLMFWAFLSGLMALAGAQLASDYSPESEGTFIAVNSEGDNVIVQEVAPEMTTHQV